MGIDEIKIGKTYKVKISDCCVEGWFTSKLVNITPPEDEYDSTKWVFENGVTLTEMFAKDGFTEEP